MGAASKRAEHPSMLALRLKMVFKVPIRNVLPLAFREGTVERARLEDLLRNPVHR